MDPSQDEAIHHERFVKVVCVGAGISGLCLAYKLQRSFTNYDLTIYEKNAEVGGTWFENRYPGCACDVPAHNYTYSFEPKADFSAAIAGWRELKQYYDDFATKYDLRHYIRFSHIVIETTWDDDKGQWNITTKDLQTGAVLRDWCHILVHATGYLNKPAWPKAPGLDAFKGPKIHSANWDETIDLKGKNIILVGSGASAVQILPAIQPIVKAAKVFIRTPRWSLPSPSQKTGVFSPEEIQNFIDDPKALMDLRLANERTLNSFFTMYMKGTVLQAQAREHLASEMKKVIVDPEVQKTLVPDFPVGCKRILPSGDKFLHTIKENNVKVVYSGVKYFTESGCVSDDGQSHTTDVVICATGFDLSFVPRFPINFRGHNLQEDWNTSITGYMGVGIAECPNSFTIAGPFTPISNGPVIVALESQTDFVCSFIDKFQTEPGMKSMHLKASASYDFRSYVAQVTKKMVWSDACRNDHNVQPNWGQSAITWPGSVLHFLEALREPRFEDYEFQYSGNRFAWLGNGLSQTEWDDTADLAYYIRDHDDGKHLSRRARLKEISKSGTQPKRVLHRQEKLSTGRL
uniref:FAD/NAD(P)-binding domain-containing protein n=1 Tax=Bionectria ochroleuca TaxID=29856 RepID=A0A0B7K767_BIOOC